MQSFQKTLARMAETGMRGFLFLALVFSVLSGFYNPVLCLVEVAAVLVLYFVLRVRLNREKEAVISYLEGVTSGVDSASRRTMLSSPLPIVLFRPDTDDIVWSNEQFLKLTGSRDHLFETKLHSLVPDFPTQWLEKGETTAPQPIPVGERRYLVFGNLVSTGTEGSWLATTYWVDVTEYADAKDRFDDTRPVLGVLQIDNFEDLIRGLDEGQLALLRTEINNALVEWFAPAQPLLRRYDRDHYILYVEYRAFRELNKRKFSVLEEIRKIQSPNGVAATLSGGFGLDAETPKDLSSYASLALDMALSRGGDQVVIKKGTEFSFVGGRARETERRTKVKSRVVASSFQHLLAEADRVVIMGHKFPDLDVLGAVAGICAIARKKGIPVSVVRAPAPNPAEEQTKRLGALAEYRGVFQTGDEIKHLITKRSLLVVVDTNRPEQTQQPEFLQMGAKIVVIDHHRRAASYIQEPALSFHDPYASSASELAAELVQYILEPGDCKRPEAEAMLAGMMLDTKSFTMRTGSRTFEIAAYLRKIGADLGQVNKFFQSNFQDAVSRYDIIHRAEIYRESIAITCTDRKVGRAVAGQAADELLGIAGIEASFVLFPEENQTCLSARSSGGVNVQVLAEMLGGGGNAATAGAQFPGKAPGEVWPMVTEAIDRYFDEDEEG